MICTILHSFILSISLIQQVENIKELYPSLVKEAKLYKHLEYVATVEDIRENNRKCRDFASMSVI
jgi:hypothetical protein